MLEEEKEEEEEKKEEEEEQGEESSKRKGKGNASAYDERRRDVNSSAQNRDVGDGSFMVSNVKEEEEWEKTPLVRGFTAVNAPHAYAPTRAHQPLPQPPRGLAGSGVRAQRSLSEDKKSLEFQKEE